ncbi:MAG: hypothetical protein ABSE58_02750 [Candidatus Limnocylindrales bacterium]|jgi:hypothetical protein
MSIGSRLPAFSLLGLVLIAAALLIAGWGVAVGVGIIAGSLLGLANFLAFLGLSSRSRGGSSVSWLSRGGPSSGPDHELLQRFGRNSMRVAGVDAGTLRRVIAVGSSVEAGSARVEIVAVEIRDDGGIATLVAHTRPPVGHVGHFVEVTVSDDAGTAYVASGQGSGGSSTNASRHEIRFAPRPPDGAHTLIVHVASFADPFPGVAARLDGPWEFRVPL